MADVVNLASRRAERRREDDEKLGQKVVDRAAHLREAGEGGDVDDGDEVPNGWASGAAKCMNCSHEWVAVAPVGTVFLACPACDCEQGRWQYPFEPQEGTILYACGCGAHEFYVVAAGATEDDLPLLRTSGGASHEHYLFCAGCGKTMNF